MDHQSVRLGASKEPRDARRRHDHQEDKKGFQEANLQLNREPGKHVGVDGVMTAFPQTEMMARGRKWAEM